MATARCQITLNRTTGQSVDDITNTWYFTTGSAGTLTDTQCNVLNDALEDFYQAWDNSFMSNFVSTAGASKFWDMEDSEPRVPVHEDTFTLSSLVSSNQLPADVAVCLSFQGDPVSGVNQRRRRGRVYLGPLVTGIYTAGTGDTEINSGFRSAIETGLTAMIATAATATPAFTHCVFSETQFASTGNVYDSIAIVTEYSIENQPDTQRRRGKAATVRSVLSP